MSLVVSTLRIVGRVWCTTVAAFARFIRTLQASCQHVACCSLMSLSLTSMVLNDDRFVYVFFLAYAGEKKVFILFISCF